MPFKKGNVPWNKGEKMPEDFCENIRKNYSGKNHPFYGRKHSKKSKLKMSASKKGKKIGCNNSNWKNGIKKDVQGYIMQYAPTHPYAINSRYVYQHRIVMELHLLRFLKRTEVVHHINGKKDDNRIENLRLFKSQACHTRFHESIRRKNRRVNNDRT